MIEKFAVRNFKSLAELTFSLGKFTCLIGLNGAGKSSILQAFDFVAQLMAGRMDDWLTMRGWTAQELNCKTRPESNIRIGLQYRASNQVKVLWDATFNRHELSCSSESIFINGVEQLRVKSGRYRIGGKLDTEISFKYQGSILSQLRDEELPVAILEFRDSMRRIRSLELLAPHLMRQRARSSDIDIGAGGEKLSAFLHGIKGVEREELTRLLRSFYPNLVDFKVLSQRSGWKRLTILEQFGELKLETEARHISDGLLRVLAILAQASTDHSLILLDEIENGINPELVEKLVDSLVDALQQIVVTTHSPMILNYLDDEVAKAAVQFIYKNPRGETRARPFFSIPRVGEKLRFMGPGEAFVDTDLNLLMAECVELDRVEAEAAANTQKSGQ